MQFTIAISVFSILFSINVGLNIDEYVKEIDKLSLNETFVEEYYKWSFDLFSQPDYLYGEKMNFPCNPSLGDNKTTATSVHQLRPSDVKVIGALGDSLTAALGAHAITIAGLLVENRGLSWSIGGDHNFNKVMSLPNIVKQYTPNLKGYSTKFSISFLNGQNSSNNGLNVAKSGGRSYHMLNQAQMLIDRIKADKTYDFNNDWKVVTFFVGGNDLCDFCVDTNMHTPEEFTGYVRDALDLLHASLPRTFVNLVLVLDIRGVQELNTGGFVCQVLYKLTCSCAVNPTPENAKILDVYVHQYQNMLKDLVATGRYDTSDDFTVVIQPFLTETKIPRTDKPGNPIDFSYFAPDCFHFSGKGHSITALSLWNNMLEPVEQKQTFWHKGEALECPTEEHPYFFTSKNSVGVSKWKKTTNFPVKESAVPFVSGKISSTRQKPNTISSTVHSRTRHHKHHQKNDELSFNYKQKLMLITGIGLISMFILILACGIRKRQNINLFINGDKLSWKNPQNSMQIMK